MGIFQKLEAFGAAPYQDWDIVDWIHYIGEAVLFLLIFITFCILCGSVGSSGTVKHCLETVKLCTSSKSGFCCET
uniref:Uncharacterized protein n=1 Tax=Panagrolaimus sp. JU765 TaxID=591449 RepID=A0AC34RTP8_9BILA